MRMNLLESESYGLKSIKCQYCNKVFHNNADFSRNVHTHTGEKPFKCKFCGNYFSQKVNLTRHDHTHTGKKSFKANFVREVFLIKEI